ncbi:hypothetical protein ACTDI4_17090 [Mesorhizobium sp. PUT5]|uniref:hypothetical protein n=1 Tax=Mesorhizobium sp. PUT5 TaxID=3454629 RepID=UPI003FA44A69
MTESKEAVRVIMREALLRGEALKIVADVRDQTVDLCIRTIESLYLDSQGLVLDADTLDACIGILRSLKLAANLTGERE